MSRRSSFLASSPVPGSKNSQTPQIRAERIDDLPILLAFAKEMGIAEVIDGAIPKVHGNRTGLSYGHLAWGFMASIGTQCDHRLSVVEGWSAKNERILEQVMGVEVGEKDFTDDRLADLLWELGDPGVLGPTMRSSRGTRPLRRPLTQPAGAVLLHIARHRNLPQARLVVALAAVAATPAAVALVYAWPG